MRSSIALPGVVAMRCFISISLVVQCLAPVPSQEAENKSPTTITVIPHGRVLELTYGGTEINVQPSVTVTKITKFESEWYKFSNAPGSHPFLHIYFAQHSAPVSSRELKKWSFICLNGMYAWRLIQHDRTHVMVRIPRLLRSLAELTVCAVEISLASLLPAALG